MAKSRLHKLYYKFIASLSFSAELRKMRRELNAKIDQPESIEPPPPFHPQAASRWFKRRRITIAESYLMVVRDLDSRHSSARLDALRKLAEVAFQSTNIDYPLNTARVQSALVKEVVKHRSNKRRQLELLYDFSMSTRGQHQTIRKLCDELNIVELPEKGVQIGGLSYGWDGHVHDTATSGRKNPTQLIIDAFIKGISSLTMAYGSVSDMEMMEEALEAGNILGLKVNIGLEFSVMVEGSRYHFMAELPHVSTREELRAFFGVHASSLDSFFQGLDTNRENRLDAVRRLLDTFNQSTLLKINEGFGEKPEYCLAPLSLDELLATIPNMNITPLHLAEFMYLQYRPVLQKRTWYYKVLREKARQASERSVDSKVEKAAIESKYAELRKELRELSTDVLLSEYFEAPHAISYQTVFGDLKSLSDLLHGAGCTIKFIHPLEYGTEKAASVLEQFEECLDSVEIYNTQDCIGRNPEEIDTFARVINEYNKRAAHENRKFVRPVCGSDATGRNPKIPGMGFIFEDQLSGKLRQRYIKRHIALTPLVSAMVRANNVPVEEAALQKNLVPRIISMGKVSSGEGYTSTSGDEKIDPIRAWRYFNPTFKNVIRTVIGFSVATAFVGPGYALLWIGITGFRNSIADLISYRGAKLNQWRLKSINFDNVAQSLFWTGFSVPILGFVKANFDVVWPLAHGTFLFNFAKFFFISFANGFYLAAHNTLRGFDKNVVRANIFRSILAWPLATIFAPLGDTLSIPSIVQTKIWSDIVAGFIEGGNKYRKVLRQRQKILEEIIPTIIHTKGNTQYIAMLDILYLFSQEPRTKSSIKAVLSPYRLFTRRLRKNSSLRLNLLVELHRTMCDERLWTELVDYIVATCDEEMADDLVDLVVEELPDLQNWLGQLIEKYSKESSLMSKLVKRKE
jgi:hypothetical protein